MPEYTAPLAYLCPWIDAVIIDPGAKASRVKQQQLKDALKRGNFDAVLCLITNARNAALLRAAEIPQRYAPATGTTFFFHNHVLRQKRSQSLKPEYEYNLDLARFMLADLHLSIQSPPQTAFFRFFTASIASNA